MSYKTVVYANFDWDEILKDVAQCSNKKNAASGVKQ
jgi:hypothetical protein